MDNGCDIKIDKEGIWYYRGAEMFRKEILSLFFQNVKKDDNGKYLIEMGEEKCYLDVEDTVFVVTEVHKTKKPADNSDCLYVLLNDDCREELALSTLKVGKDNVLYCQVKEGRFAARFLRKSYYQLSEFIEEEENRFFIRQSGEKYYIKNN